MALEPNRRQIFQLAALGAVATGLAACTQHTAQGKAPAASPSTPPSDSPAPSSGPTHVPGSPAVEVVAGPTNVNKVALTFHTNGDITECRQLVQAADDGGAKITAFFVGNWLAANPSFAELIKRGGHDFGNHTYDHPDPFGTLDNEAMLAEIVKCSDVLTRIMGTPGKWFRPSAMVHATPQVLVQAGKAGYATSVSYGVDSTDNTDPGTQTVVDRTLSNVKPGSIVSLHMGHSGTIKALPKILDGLRSAGLAPVTLSELLGA